MSLSPSRRLTLITEIAKHLVPQGYGVIDLTLKQFSLPTATEGWGSPEQYLFEMVQAATDESLIELAAHFGFAFESPKTHGANATFWKPGYLKLSISHLAVHRKWVAELQAALFSFGIYGFLAHNDIEPTSEWMTQIESALATCDALVALLHDDFHVSKWTDQEIGYAMGRGVPVCAVRLGQDPYGFIGRFQAFNGRGKTPKAVAIELYLSYSKNRQTQKKMAEAAIVLFEGTSSFAEAHNRISNLETLEYWEPAFAGRIRVANETNSQINGAWNVPQRVEKLAVKWEVARI